MKDNLSYCNYVINSKELHLNNHPMSVNTHKPYVDDPQSNKFLHILLLQHDTFDKEFSLFVKKKDFQKESDNVSHNIPVK